MTKFRHILTSYTRIDFAVIPEDGIERPCPYILVDTDGETIDPATLREYLLRVLMRREREQSDMEPGEHVERIRMVPGNLSIVDTVTGANKKVRQINLVAYSRNEEVELSTDLEHNLN